VGTRAAVKGLAIIQERERERERERESPDSNVRSNLVYGNTAFSHKS
jgi:hypothetical protein